MSSATVTCRSFEVLSNEFEDDASFRVHMKHRREDFHDIDDKLYSSLRYQLRLQIVHDNSDKVSLPLKSDVVLCDENGDAVEQQDNSVDGTLSAELETSAEEANCLEGHLLLHIQSHLSYHFTRKDYKLKLIVSTVDDEQKQVASLISPKFRLFARKPNKKQYSRIKKRKQREEEQQYIAQKKMKLSQQAEQHFQPQHHNPMVHDLSSSFVDQYGNMCVDPLSSVPFNPYCSPSGQTMGLDSGCMPEANAHVYPTGSPDTESQSQCGTFTNEHQHQFMDPVALYRNRFAYNYNVLLQQMLKNNSNPSTPTSSPHQNNMLNLKF